MFDYSAITFLALVGLAISTYLAHKKKNNEALVCPMKAHCNFVIHSKYSKFLGVSIEIWGIGYYGFLALGYTLLLGGYSQIAFIYLLLALTSGAFLFSLYLTFIQIFAIKQFCSWCLFSAGLSTLIFIISISGSMETIVPFLQAQKPELTILHLVGVAVGVGAATIGDLFFFKFLKDFRISEFEADVLNFISQITWLALAVIVTAGLGLFLGDMPTLLKSDVFILKMIVVLVIIVNGAMLNLLVAPKLVQISFGEKHDHMEGELARLRKLAFTFGPISLLSWYFAFVIGASRGLQTDFSHLFLLYVFLLLVSMAFGRFLERSLVKKANKN